MNDMCVLKNPEGRYLVVYDPRRITTTTLQKAATRFRPEYAHRFRLANKTLHLRVVRLVPKSEPISACAVRASVPLQKTV